MKRMFYLAFALLVLMTSWEQQRVDAALAKGPIPQDSIRLRIIANSDLPQDQLLKRKIRDELIENITEWVGELEDLETAKQVIQSRLPELENIVEGTIQKNGYTYDSSVELGKVPFPTKMYGNYVYPAGEYEALRVVIGEGLGENWWCVLFPPLCFVDITNGDAMNPVDSEDKKVGDSSLQMDDSGNQQRPQKQQPEVRFFIVELLEKLVSLFT